MAVLTPALTSMEARYQKRKLFVVGEAVTRLHNESCAQNYDSPRLQRWS